jgi:hypothetical protein
MASVVQQNPSLLRRIAREASEYWANFLYLAVFLGAFAWYHRLLAPETDATYHYGTALINAALLAKIIMIGNWLHLNRGLERHPLIFSTLYHSFIFMLWAELFELSEQTALGLLQGKGWLAGATEAFSVKIEETAARCLVMFIVFIPFFAFKEADRVLGEGKLRSLFFRRRPA